MSYRQNPPPPAPGNTPSFRVLSAQFLFVVQGLEDAVRQMDADSRRMIPATEIGIASLRQLTDKLSENAGYRGRDWYETLLGRVTESSTLFRQAAHQIQFYDIMQQQLAHLGNAYRHLAHESDRLVEAPRTELHYLHALSDIVPLHIVQLAGIAKQHATEITEWQGRLGQGIADLARAGGIAGSSLPPTTRPEAEVSGMMQALVADVAAGWLKFERQEAAAGRFSATLASVQAALSRLSARLPHLPPNPAARAAALAQLRAGCTMQSERTPYDQVLDGLPESSLPQSQSFHEIELF